MADRFVRVTLEAPYVNKGGETLDEVSIRYGTEPATLASGGYVADGSDQAVPVSERAGAPPKFIPGKPVIYTMKWSDAEHRQMIVPDYVAVNYFGDWNVKPGMVQSDQSSAERSHPAEKRRIEAVWGMCAKEARNANIPNHWRNLRKTAPPAVPRVVIHLLDSAYRLVPHFEYRPWEHFGWEQDAYAKVVDLNAVPQPSSNALQMTPELKAMMDAYITQQVAAGLAAQSAQAPRGKAA